MFRTIHSTIQYLESFRIPLQNQEEYLLLHHDHTVQEEGVKALMLQEEHYQDSKIFEFIIKRNTSKIVSTCTGSINHAYTSTTHMHNCIYKIRK